MFDETSDIGNEVRDYKLENIAQPPGWYWWKGHWGEESSKSEKLSGPRSPRWRNDRKGNELLYGAKEFHNTWIRKGDEDLKIPVER